MTTATLRKRAEVGNPHVWFDGEKGASARPRRSSLLYKRIVVSSCMFAGAIASATGVACAANLPPNCVAVDYIESTGSQYVNTGLNLCGTDKIEVRASFTDLSLDAQGVFCTRANDGSSATREFAVVYRNVLAMCQSTSDVLRANDSPFVVNDPRTIVFDGYAQSLFIDGERQDLTFTGPNDYTATTPLFIFAMRSAGGPATWSKMRLYSFTVRDKDGNVRANFVPCVKVEGETETAGLYDLTRNDFYESDGTGAFLAAPHFTLPPGYQEAEFLQVFARCLQLDLVPNRTDRIEMDFAFTRFPDERSTPAGIFCARDGQGTAATRLMFQRGDGVLTASYGSDYVSSVYSPQLLERLKTVFDGKKRQVLVNGETILSFANEETADFTPTARLNLFALGNEVKPDLASELRLYDFEITDEVGVIRARLVPCYETETGRAGAYDLVGRKFYPVTDAAAPSLTLPSEYEELEYIESTGDEYIDLGLKPNGLQTIEARISFADVTRGAQGVFCSRKDSINMDRIMCVLYDGGTMRQFYQSAECLSGVIWKADDVHTVRMEGRTGEFSVDGIVEHSFTPLGFGCEQELRLFALNSGAGAKMRLYSFLFLNENYLYRDKLYPAKRLSDGELGLYCANRHMFFTNMSGKGGFRAGPKTKNRWLEVPSISKMSWTTEERPGVLSFGRAMAGEVVCDKTAADILSMRGGEHEIVFSVQADDVHTALERRIVVTVSEHVVPTVDPGELTVRPIKVAGAVIGARLTFPAANVARECWAVWDGRDVGPDPAAWANRRRIATVAAGATSAEVTFPEPLESGGFRIVLAVPLTAGDYVQEGLVVQFDGIENAGPGRHLPSIAAWRNLKARTDTTDAPTHYGDVFEDDAINLGLAAHTTLSTVLPNGMSGPLTIEVNAKPQRIPQLKTLALIASISGRGGFGWSGPERSGCITTWRVDTSSRQIYQTFETAEFKTLSDLIGDENPYRTFSALLGPADESVDLNGKAMSPSSFRFTSDILPSEAALTLGSETAGAKLRSVRIYDRELTADEKAKNLLVDAVRFDGGAPLASRSVVSVYKDAKPGFAIIFR